MTRQERTPLPAAASAACMLVMRAAIGPAAMSSSRSVAGRPGLTSVPPEITRGLPEPARLVANVSMADSQIVKAADTGSKNSRGFHGGKKINGRGRHVAVDVEGWLLSIVVTGAQISDRAGARLLVMRLLNVFTTLQIMWADSGYDGKPLASWIERFAAITLQIIKRSDLPGFQVVSRRWVVERTFGWLLRYRRLVRDYERRIEHHEAMVYWAN